VTSVFVTVHGLRMMFSLTVFGNHHKNYHGLCQEFIESANSKFERILRYLAAVFSPL